VKKQMMWRPRCQERGELMKIRSLRHGLERSRANSKERAPHDSYLDEICMC
jgi:hypothetical protein